MNRHAPWFKIVGCLWALCGPLASAQWRTQEVPLRAGWNAVYLQVQPLPADCDSQFAGTPVAEAHRFNQRVRVALFDTDPSKPFRRPAEWLTWRPDDGTNRHVRTLANLTGDTAYLIHTTNAHVWKVSGRPVLPSREWVPGIPNLVGFPIDPSASPTFAEFFAAEPRIPVVGGPADLFVQDIDANLNGIDLTTRTRRQTLSAGRAYWIRARDSSRFAGPLVVTTSHPRGLLFGDDANELLLQVRNLSSNALPVTLRHVASESPPPGMPRKEGHVPLLVYRTEGTPGAPGAWDGWGVDEAKNATLGPGEHWQLRLAVDRSRMGNSSAPTNTWQSLVLVSGGGLRLEVPANAAKAVAGGAAAPYPAGLWVGEARLTNVTYLQPPANIVSTNPAVETPLNAGVRQPFPLRLIVHQSTSSNISLLPRALLAVSTNSGTPVMRLFSSEARAGLPLQQWHGLSRISSPAFAGLGSALPLEAYNPTNWLGSYSLTATNALNPYRHLYHPQHGSGFPISGVIRFALDSDPATGRPGGPGPDPEETLTGTYSQQIYGLRNEPITLSGPFTLRRVSSIGQLDIE